MSKARKGRREGLGNQFMMCLHYWEPVLPFFRGVESLDIATICYIFVYDNTVGSIGRGLKNNSLLHLVERES